MKQYLIFLSILISLNADGQRASILGQVVDAYSNEPLAFANVVLMPSNQFAATDDDGNFLFENIEAGVYDVQVSFLGYENQQATEIQTSAVKPAEIIFRLEPLDKVIDEVVVKGDRFRKKAESPLSLRSIGQTEIKRNPGGNRDISLVVRSFPGVTSSTSFRNDLIIRGGAPNENRFYLDDVEIPNINHFATQGASGGPAGILNVDFIREVDFYSGAFPANRANALSSVFDFKQRDGRKDRVGFSATVGASDLGISAEGPLGKNTTFLLSARRSYLQFLFDALNLPFLPTYNDFQLKVKHKIGKHHELTFIGVGAIDDFSLNLEANETEFQRYTLDQLPHNEQWTYTNGLVYKYYRENGFTTFVLSRNMIDYEAEKFLNNDDSSSDNLNLNYNSREIENHLRIQNTNQFNKYKLQYGIRADYVKYSNSTFRRAFDFSGPVEINYESDLDFYKYGLFGQLSFKVLNEKLNFSFGLRSDANTYSNEMSNLFETLSPRLSLSYELTSSLDINFNSGIYYQLPAYTVLGYRENGILVNKENGLKHIKNNHVVAGLSYETNFGSKISLEGYFKKYYDYPFAIRDSISLANLGGDFGVIGNTEVVSNSDGQTFGAEFMFQQKLYKGFYGIFSYTLGASEFEDKNERLIPSSWDARHIANLTLGKRFNKNWEVGIKWRYQSGLPLTPDSPNSDLVINWDRNAGAIPDYSLLNSERFNGLSEVDVRVDKKWFFRKWNLEFYLDLKNIFAQGVDVNVLVLDLPLDPDGKPIGNGEIINPNAPLNEQRYKTKILSDEGGTLLPTIGVVVEI